MRDLHKMRPEQLLGLAEHMAADPKLFQRAEAEALHKRCTRYRGSDEALAHWAALALEPLLEDEATPWGQDAKLPVVPGQLGLFGATMPTSPPAK